MKLDVPEIPLGPCLCPDWAPNVKLVNEPFAFLTARNPDTYHGYRGKGFTHCPWCGSALRLFVDPSELPSTVGDEP